MGENSDLVSCYSSCSAHSELTKMCSASCLCIFFMSRDERDMIQGQSWQTVIFELALTDTNMQVRFYLKGFLKS